MQRGVWASLPALRAGAGAEGIAKREPLPAASTVGPLAGPQHLRKRLAQNFSSQRAAASKRPNAYWNLCFNSF